jgi:hypothetical protein
MVVTAAAGAAAALLLTACGGGDGKAEGNDKIAGVDTGTRPSTSPGASAGVGGTASGGRPTVTLPSDARNVFENETTGDVGKDAVLADNARRIESIDDAIFRGSVNTEALGFYSAEGALDSARRVVKGYLDDERSWTGTTRYFDRRVTFRPDGGAVVVYCSDESRSFLRNRKTDKVEKTPASADTYVLYNTRLARNPAGVWQTVNVISKRGAAQCRP